MRALVVVAVLCGCQKPARVDPAAPARDLAVAAPTGPLDVTTLDGKRVAFASYARKVTFIALWATFCKPCMDELPMVQAQEWREGFAAKKTGTINLVELMKAEADAC